MTTREQRIAFLSQFLAHYHIPRILEINDDIQQLTTQYTYTKKLIEKTLIGLVNIKTLSLLFAQSQDQNTQNNYLNIALYSLLSILETCQPSEYWPYSFLEDFKKMGKDLAVIPVTDSPRGYTFFEEDGILLHSCCWGLKQHKPPKNLADVWNNYSNKRFSKIRYQRINHDYFVLQHELLETLNENGTRYSLTTHIDAGSALLGSEIILTANINNHDIAKFASSIVGWSAPMMIAHSPESIGFENPHQEKAYIASVRALQGILSTTNQFNTIKYMDQNYVLTKEAYDIDNTDGAVIYCAHQAIRIADLNNLKTLLAQEKVTQLYLLTQDKLYYIDFDFKIGSNSNDLLHSGYIACGNKCKIQQLYNLLLTEYGTLPTQAEQAKKLTPAVNDYITHTMRHLRYKKAIFEIMTTANTAYYIGKNSLPLDARSKSKINAIVMSSCLLNADCITAQMASIFNSLNGLLLMDYAVHSLDENNIVATQGIGLEKFILLKAVLSQAAETAAYCAHQQINMTKQIPSRKHLVIYREKLDLSAWEKIIKNYSAAQQCVFINTPNALYFIEDSSALIQLDLSHTDLTQLNKSYQLTHQQSSELPYLKNCSDQSILGDKLEMIYGSLILDKLLFQKAGLLTQKFITGKTEPQLLFQVFLKPEQHKQISGHGIYVVIQRENQDFAINIINGGGRNLKNLHFKSNTPNFTGKLQEDLYYAAKTKNFSLAQAENIEFLQHYIYFILKITARNFSDQAPIHRKELLQNIYLKNPGQLDDFHLPTVFKGFMGYEKNAIFRIRDNTFCYPAQWLSNCVLHNMIYSLVSILGLAVKDHSRYLLTDLIKRGVDSVISSLNAQHFPEAREQNNKTEIFINGTQVNINLYGLGEAGEDFDDNDWLIFCESADETEANDEGRLLLKSTEALIQYRARSTSFGSATSNAALTDPNPTLKRSASFP